MKIIDSKILMSIFLLAMFTISCGKNAFISQEEADPAEDATILLEQDDAEGAIKVCVTALGEDAEAALELTDFTALTSALTAAIAELDMEDREIYKIVSVLSAAYAQLYGLDPLSVALKMATGDSEEESTESSSGEEDDSNEITALFPVLPDATTENIDGIGKAVAVIDAIPDTSKTASDLYKKALMITSLFSLRMKSLDADNDGQISTLESRTLPDGDAATILAQMIIAQEVLNQSSAAGGGDSSAEAAQKVADYQTSIQEEDGADDNEKLRNFIAKQ